jgi:hypothetical protein
MPAPLAAAPLSRLTPMLTPPSVKLLGSLVYSLPIVASPLYLRLRALPPVLWKPATVNDVPDSVFVLIYRPPHLSSEGQLHQRLHPRTLAATTTQRPLATMSITATIGNHEARV